MVFNVITYHFKVLFCQTLLLSVLVGLLSYEAWSGMDKVQAGALDRLVLSMSTVELPATQTLTTYAKPFSLFKNYLWNSQLWAYVCIKSAV